MTFELKGMFDCVDQKSIEGFLEYLSDDVVFRFGNSPEMVSKEVVRVGIELFFTQIKSLEHVLKGSWSEGRTRIMQFDTYYTKHDGLTVGVPCCVVVLLNAERLICDYRIHIDLSPLHSHAPDSYLIRKSA